MRHVPLEEDPPIPTASRVQVRLRAKGATVASSIANLANTNMGVGMLALPAAMANAGFLGGSALLLLSMSIAAFGSHLLAECVAVVGRPATLSTITTRALGAPGIILTDAAVVVISTSCAIGYLIVIGDMLPEVCPWFLGETVVDEGALLGKREFWIAAVLPIIVPLSFLRRLESLGAASCVVVCCVVLTAVTVLLFAFEPSAAFAPCDVEATGSAAAGRVCVGKTEAVRDMSHTLSSFPTFLFAFAAQINVPSIVSELRQPSRSRQTRVLLGGHAFTALAYLIVAVCAYVTYGSRISTDLLVSYPPTAILARVAMIFVVLLSHPIVSYPVGPCIASIHTTLSRWPWHRRGLHRIQSCTSDVRSVELGGLGSTCANAGQKPSTDDRSVKGEAPNKLLEGDIDLGVASDACGAAQTASIANGDKAPAALTSATAGTAADASFVVPPSAPTASLVFVTEREQVLIRTIYLVGTTLCALTVTDLGIVVSLAGAVSATAVIFIAPGACYYALHPLGSLRRGAAALCVLGCLLVPILLVLVLAAHGGLGAEWALDSVERQQ